MKQNIKDKFEIIIACQDEETADAVRVIMKKNKKVKLIKEKNRDGQFAAYEKIKRITVPLSDKHILFISVDNTPLKTRKQSYGHLVEMGKIMSIVNFVNEAN